ncbi:hypothetical protein JXQ70_20520 [bacterium]|nr:hypothetical protein [bacterium]
MIKKLLMVALTSLAATAYIKRREIAYATIGAVASVEEKLRKLLDDVSQRYLSS